MTDHLPYEVRKAEAAKIDFSAAIRREAEAHADFFDGITGAPRDERVAGRISVSRANVTVGHVDYLRPFLAE